MTTKIAPGSSTRDLIDGIAKALPADIRENYYREMMYCRSLQENDEILRVLRAMQFLTLLMEQVPSRVITEREKLEGIFSEAAKSLKAVLNSNNSYQKQLDERLAGLPIAVAKGIHPEIIAGSINRSLNQQFASSTIPHTAEELMVIAEQLKEVSTEFRATASTLGSAYRGAAEEAREAIVKINASVTGAARSAKVAAQNLSAKFRNAYWRLLIGLTLVALWAGLLLGIYLVRKFDPPQVNVIERIIIPAESIPAAKPGKR